MKILGISAFYHDSAACLIVDGEICSAVQEERFTRVKHDSRFPHYAIEYILKKKNISIKDIDYIAFYDKPFLKFERLLETYLAFAPKGYSSFAKSLPVWIKDKLFQKKTILDELKKIDSSIRFNDKLLFSEHHQSHAASAFYPSPFENAAILTMDGVGEWATTSLAVGEGQKMTMRKEIHFPHSLGLLYSAFTYYTGFKVNSGEYKVMGLAPYGNPKYVNLIKDNIIDIKSDGSYRLNMNYFNYCTGLTMTNHRFHELFGGDPRKPDRDPITQKEMDLAASVQVVIEDAVIALGRGIKKETGLNNLCLAGGVALNCVANGKLLREQIFDKIWIQPASGDAGGALGSALLAYYHFLSKERIVREADAMKGAYLGPSFKDAQIEDELTKIGAKFKIVPYDEMIEETAQSLADGKAVGWFQGAMEFGPRALGARSILGDPRSPSMQKNLNLKVKFRESFRPFAPSVLEEHVSKWFEIEQESPYMLLVADVKKDKQKKMNEEEENLFGIDKLNVPRSEIPAVTHVDYSARVQTVNETRNPVYYHLIKSFYEKTNVPVLVNTSFNVRGEPIVCTPEDAFRCFMGTNLDLLIIGNAVLKKEDQDSMLKERYEDKFELD